MGNIHQLKTTKVKTRINPTRISKKQERKDRFKTNNRRTFFFFDLSQDGLTGSAWGDWSLYTDSPLRAFENELGVQVGVRVVSFRCP